MVIGWMNRENTADQQTGRKNFRVATKDLIGEIRGNSYSQKVMVSKHLHPPFKFLFPTRTKKWEMEKSFIRNEQIERKTNSDTNKS